MSDKKKKKRIDPDREILISVHDLRKSFDGQEVLKGINFVVHRGEVVSIIGPSGCGKSTLIRSLNLLEQPDSGSIRFEDEEIVGLHEREQNKVREKIGMVFQQFNLFKNKTVLDNITLAPVKLGLMKPDKAKEEAMRLLERIGLADKAANYPAQLSGGQQQRDEVLTLMKDLAATGMTMVVVTHEIGFAREVSDRVVFIDEGVIKEDGSPDEVLNNPEDDRLRDFLGNVLK